MNTKQHQHKNWNRATGSYWALYGSFLVILPQHVQSQQILVIKRTGHTAQFINSMNHVNCCLFMNMSYCTMKYKQFCIVWTYTMITHPIYRLEVMIMACLTEVSTLPAGKNRVRWKWMLKVSPKPHHLKDINFLCFNKYTVYKYHDNCSYILNTETKTVNTIKQYY